MSKKNVPISHFKLYAVLLAKAQKYYLPPGAGNPSYTTERWAFRFRFGFPLVSGGWSFATRPPTSI